MMATVSKAIAAAANDTGSLGGTPHTMLASTRAHAESVELRGALGRLATAMRARPASSRMISRRASWARLLQEVHSSCLTDEACESLRFRTRRGTSRRRQVIVPPSLIFAWGGRVFADESIVLEPGHGEVQGTGAGVRRTVGERADAADDLPSVRGAFAEGQEDVIGKRGERGGAPWLASRHGKAPLGLR